METRIGKLLLPFWSSSPWQGNDVSKRDLASLSSDRIFGRRVFLLFVDILGVLCDVSAVVVVVTSVSEDEEKYA